MNPWVIDVDHMADENRKPPCNGNAKGMVGPRSYRGDGSELEERFRMYDDDGNLYYEGRSMEVGFEPLDDVGVGLTARVTITELVHCARRELVRQLRLDLEVGHAVADSRVDLVERAPGRLR